MKTNSDFSSNKFFPKDVTQPFKPPDTDVSDKIEAAWCDLSGEFSYACEPGEYPAVHTIDHLHNYRV